MIFTIEIAGKRIRITSLYERVYKMCLDYLVDEKSDIDIEITEADIEFEREKTDGNHGRAFYSDDYLETLAVYRKIASAMPDYDAWLMHGAVISVKEQAYLFTASSGTGKTTLIQLILKQIEDAFVVNGDKPLLKFSNFDHSVLYACGTPWSGKERMNRNCIVPMKAIVILQRGDENKIQEISFAEAFPILLQQTYKDSDVNLMRKTLALLSKVAGKVNLYRMTFKYYDSASEIEKEEVQKVLHTIWDYPEVKMKGKKQVILGGVMAAVTIGTLMSGKYTMTPKMNDIKAEQLLLEAKENPEIVRATFHSFSEKTDPKDALELVIMIQRARGYAALTDGDIKTARVHFMACGKDEIALAELDKLNEYEAAVRDLNDGKYEEARKVFSADGDYLDSEAKLEVCNAALYDAALTDLKEGRVQAAYARFVELGDYRDCKKQAEEIKEKLTNNKREYLHS